LREYDLRSVELEAVGASLVVLTADSEPVLREAIAEHGFGARFVVTDKSFWKSWGLYNRMSRKLPHPTTLVVAPDGTVIFREIHVNYTKRAPIPDLIALVAQHKQGAEPAAVAVAQKEPEPAPKDSGLPDWERALNLQVRQDPQRLELELQVAAGFHVYGANETTSRPLAVSVDQLPKLQVPIPAGTEKDLGEAMGTVWVLEGEVLLGAELPADAPTALSGALEYQVCTDELCAAPTSTTWSTAAP